MSDTMITTLRLPVSLLERADNLIEPLAEQEDALVIGRVSRSVVLRLAVLRGLEQLEAQTGVAAPAPKSSKRASKKGR